VTLFAAQDGVCIEDVWIDYKLVNDPSTPIYLSSTEDEFPGEDVVSMQYFDAPDCRKPSVAPTVEPSPAPTSMPTEEPSPAPLECVEIRNLFTDLVDMYDNEQQVCQNTEEQYVTLATQDGCDYGITCARCDNLAIDEPLSAPVTNVDPDAVLVGSPEAAGLQFGEVRGPQGTVMYISRKNEIYIHDQPYYRRTCVEYKPSADQYCTNKNLICAGDGVVGTIAEIEKEVLLAMSQGDGIHPFCPSSCQGLSDTVKAHFIKMEVPDYENICVHNSLYYYKDPSTRTREFTCVGSGERLEVCPADTYLCVGFDDNTGMKTYGFLDWQAAAVKTALSIDSKVHPYCPSYAHV